MCENVVDDEAEEGKNKLPMFKRPDVDNDWQVSLRSAMKLADMVSRSRLVDVVMFSSAGEM